MIRVLIKYLAPILLALAPLLTNQYSLLDLGGISADAAGIVSVPYFGQGQKPQVEMKLRAVLTAAGIVFLLLSGYFDAYRPSRSLEAFRYEYLDNLVKDWRDRLKIRSDIRINVMYLYWKPYWPFSRIFKPLWPGGVQEGDRDGRLRLCSWQGLCGKVARAQAAMFVDFRTQPVEAVTFRQKHLLGNRFRMFSWQLKKTRDLKAILSVPIFEKRGPKGEESVRCVGVINLDTRTEKGAEFLSNKANDLTPFLAKYGTLIAKLR